MHRDGIRPRLLVSLSIAALLAIGALGSAAGAASKVPPPVKTGIAKQQSGPYTLGDGPVTVKKTKSFYVKVVNTTADKMHLTLDDRTSGDSPGDFKVRWFRNDRNVTAAAVSPAGYGFPLQSQTPKIFRLEIKPLVNNPGAVCPFGAFILPDASEAYAFLYVNSTSVCG